jgi:high affinity Mn2+ porin
MAAPRSVRLLAPLLFALSFSTARAQLPPPSLQSGTLPGTAQLPAPSLQSGILPGTAIPDDVPGKGDKKEAGNGEGKKSKGEAEDAEGKKKEAKQDKDKDEKKDEDKEKEAPKEQWWNVHAQSTLVPQGNWKFRSPYVGPNSLPPILAYRTTATGTLYLDTRVWEGGDIVFNPEFSGGTGLGNTLGLAGFPNGEATRVGQIAPTPYIARLLIRQTFGLGGEQEDVEDGPNQLAGKRDVDRLTFRIGKMSAQDIFDDNRYSHDPRTQFLNWSLMYNGAWDYPANTRGYNYGATVELNTKWRALRYGIFGEPAVANGADIDPRFLKANGNVFEWEERYEVADRPGKLRLLAYLNNAHMGNYRQALELSPQDPDITQTRRYRVKYGFGVNWEQELSEDLGVFARLGWNDGHTESWAFTEIDATAAFGWALRGRAWCREQDVLGLAFVINGLSGPHRDYLAAGGVGFIIGDGRLNYGPEQILEMYYAWELRKGIIVTFDFQGVNHPAYNADRGPVAIAAIRAHLEY